MILPFPSAYLQTLNFLLFSHCVISGGGNSAQLTAQLSLPFFIQPVPVQSKQSYLLIFFHTLQQRSPIEGCLGTTVVINSL